MISSTAGVAALILAYIASFISETSSDPISLYEDVAYDIPDRLEDRGEDAPVSLAELLESKRAGLDIGQLFNIIRKQHLRQKKKRTCSFELAKNCNTLDLLEARALQQKLANIESPGRKRRAAEN